jgi:hypothetical protein
MVLDSLPNAPLIYKIDKLDDDIKRTALSRQLTGKISHPPVSKWKNDNSNIQSKVKRINPYGFLAGVITYHTANLYMTKILLSEKSYKGFLFHIGMCFAAGYVTGLLVGRFAGIDYKMKKKSDSLNSILERIN